MEGKGAPATASRPPEVSVDCAMLAASTSAEIAASTEVPEASNTPRPWGCSRHNRALRYR